MTQNGEPTKIYNFDLKRSSVQCSWNPQRVWKRENFLPLPRIEPWLSETLPLIRRHIYFVIELGLRVNSLKPHTWRTLPHPAPCLHPVTTGHENLSVMSTGTIVFLFRCSYLCAPSTETIPALGSVYKNPILYIIFMYFCIKYMQRERNLQDMPVFLLFLSNDVELIVIN